MSSSSLCNVCDPNKHETLGIRVARVRRLHPNSNKSRQPPVGDTSNFKISHLVTNGQSGIHAKFEAGLLHHHYQLNIHFLPRLIKGMNGCFPIGKKLFWLTCNLLAARRARPRCSHPLVFKRDAINSTIVTLLMYYIFMTFGDIWNMRMMIETYISANNFISCFGYIIFS